LGFWIFDWSPDASIYRTYQFELSFRYLLELDGVTEEITSSHPNNHPVTISPSQAETEKNVLVNIGTLPEAIGEQYAGYSVEEMDVNITLVYNDQMKNNRKVPNVRIPWPITGGAAELYNKNPENEVHGGQCPTFPIECLSNWDPVSCQPCGCGTGAGDNCGDSELDVELVVTGGVANLSGIEFSDPVTHIINGTLTPHPSGEYGFYMTEYYKKAGGAFEQ